MIGPEADYEEPARRPDPPGRRFFLPYQGSDYPASDPLDEDGIPHQGFHLPIGGRQSPPSSENRRGYGGRRQRVDSGVPAADAHRCRWNSLEGLGGDIQAARDRRQRGDGLREFRLPEGLHEAGQVGRDAFHLGIA